MKKKFWKSPCCGDTTVACSGPRKSKKTGKYTCYRRCTNCGKKHRVEVTPYGYILGLYEPPKPEKAIYKEDNTTFIELDENYGDMPSIESLQKRLDYILSDI